MEWLIGSSGGSQSTGDSAGESSSTISTTAWYNIVNTNSTLCVDAASWGYSDGTVIQQYACGVSQANQEWQFQPTDSGYYQIVNRYALIRTGHSRVWNVTGGPWATANQVAIELWSYAGGTNQQWMPVSLGNGAYKFVARNSYKCLDVPGASSAVLGPVAAVRLQWNRGAIVHLAAKVRVPVKWDGVCGMRKFSGSHGSDALYQGTTLVGPRGPTKIWAFSPRGTQDLKIESQGSLPGT